jgi:hypothetical protein
VERVTTSQQLKTALLSVGGLLLAVYIGASIGSNNYLPVLIGGLVAAALVVWFPTGPFFWVLVIASSFLRGTFPILGGAFTPFQILMLMGVTKFIVEDVILRRTAKLNVPRFDMLMIIGFMSVLTLHALHDRFGMRFLGSSVWGGHNYVDVFVGLAAFFVVQSIPVKPKAWAILPYVVLAVATFDLLIAAITTIAPSTIYKIYPFYSAVSTLGIEEIVTGESDVTGRIGAFGSFGFILITVILASTSLRQILNPKNGVRLIFLFGGLVAVLFSGFRSALVNVLTAFVAAGIRDLRSGVFALLPLIALFLFGLSVVNSQFVHLPKQVQRALSFVPGTWDAEMAHDAAGSNEFRREAWGLWIHGYFPAHPLLGRGFGFRREWVQPSVYNPRAVDYRQTVETGNLHNGLFAALDAFGLVGTVFFVVWVLRMLVRSLLISFRRGGSDATAFRFVALYLAVWIITYWFGAQTVGSFLPVQFALGGVFLRLQRERSSDLRAEQTDTKVPPPVASALAPA